LFFLVGSLYNRFHTKNIKYLGGLVSFMRFFSVMFFLFSLANISVPGTMTFVAETLIFLGLFYRSLFSGIFIALIIVLGAGYTI
jgi:NADH:ubiquinone oxidoreductase subunit 4 (subunit M)